MSKMEVCECLQKENLERMATELAEHKLLLFGDGNGNKGIIRKMDQLRAQLYLVIALTVLSLAANLPPVAHFLNAFFR